MNRLKIERKSNATKVETLNNRRVVTPGTSQEKWTGSVIGFDAFKKRLWNGPRSQSENGWMGGTRKVDGVKYVGGNVENNNGGELI
ncbi:hypothetical protein IFM46972_08640 [Aspergillus udagawae]|uniref:Uncharacterized protein n=1 Tax=Aspergillus udagawae TaxID=91492 RepID=A0A8H3PGF5_9EURO|nr:hypothetical protein IFM46972_08640 [Aspergillus udagawae]